MKGVVAKALGENLAPVHVDLAEQRAAIATLTAKVDRLVEAVGGKVPNRAPAPSGACASALSFLIDIGCPQKGRRALVHAVSGRLTWFCAEHGYPTRVTAERGIRLFSVAAIAAWRRAGGDIYLDRCRDRMARRAA